MKEVGSSRSVVVTYFNTALAVALGVVGLHEALTSGIIFGFPLVLIGCVFATGRPKQPASLSEAAAQSEEQSELAGEFGRDLDHAVDQQPE